MINDAKIEYVKGDTYSRDFSISGYEEDIDNVLFTIKNNESDKRSILQKSLDDGITLVSDEDGVKTYNILIDANDTDNFKVGYDYYFAIKIFTDEISNDIETTIIKGTFTLSARGD